MWRRRPSPADDKLAPLAPRLDPLDRDVGDPRTAGPPAGPGDELLDHPWLTLDLGLHRAVGPVPDPTGEAQPFGFIKLRASRIAYDVEEMRAAGLLEVSTAVVVAARPATCTAELPALQVTNFED